MNEDNDAEDYNWQQMMRKLREREREREIGPLSARVGAGGNGPLSGVGAKEEVIHLQSATPFSTSQPRCLQSLKPSPLSMSSGVAIHPTISRASAGLSSS